MLSNQKNKRKSAGFIRTSSVKALHNFKQTDLSSSSSSDFSSFENQNLQPEKSEYQFSPYKNSYPSKQRYQLPPKPPVGKPHTSGKVPKENNKQESEPNRIFTNQRLINNYQPNNNPRGQSAQIVTKREQQIRQNLRKRAQVERQLKDINKVCAEVDKMRSPYLKDQGSNNRFFKAERVQVQNIKSLEKKPRVQNENIEEESDEQFSHFNQSHDRQDEFNQPSFKPVATKISRGNEKFLQKKYEFQQSSIKQQSENDSENYDIENVRDTQKQQQFSTYRYDQTFHPNANRQILTSIQQYKKKYIPTSNMVTIQSTRSPGSIHKKNFTEHESDEYLKEQHQRARQKFISINNEEQSLIQQYPTQQFKKTTIKDAYMTQNGSNQYKSTNSVNRDGIYKAKGGICFDLDVNQFTNVPGHHESIQKRQNVVVTNKAVQGGAMKKKKKVNQKQEILKRRQMAKNYDREARARVFGGY